MLIKAIFTNSSGILVSRVLGFIRDLLTASILGANVYSDIFFVAFKIPNLFRRIFGEGAFSTAFLPSYAHSNHKIRFSAQIIFFFFVIILLLSLLVTLFSYEVTWLIAYGFSDENTYLASKFVAINFYYLDLIFLVTVFGAILQYKNKFAISAYSTALLNIAMIAALLIAQNMEKIVIVEYLSWGVVAGGILQLIAHLMTLKTNYLKNLFKAMFEKKQKTKDDVKYFKKQFLPSMIGSSTAQISSFLDTLIASFLATGSISYLYYANRVFQLPLALFAIATSVAIFPMIAKAIKNNDETKAIKLLAKGFWLLFVTLLVSVIVGIVFSKEITWLLFEHGEFDASDTHVTSIVLSMYLIGLIPFGIAKIFSLWLYSNNQQLKAAKISIFSIGWSLVFSIVLSYYFGVYGLALSGSLGGVILLHLTLKSFGYKRFKEEMLLKYPF